MDARLLFEEGYRSQMPLLSDTSYAHDSKAKFSRGSNVNVHEQFSLPALSRHTPRGEGDGLTARRHAQEQKQQKLSTRTTPRALLNAGEQTRQLAGLADDSSGFIGEWS